MKESKPESPVIKLTQMGTAYNPTPRQIAAGFVPITPVRAEAEVTPGYLDISRKSEESGGCWFSYIL
jgi:hypothetical protein